MSKSSSHLQSIITSAQGMNGTATQRSTSNKLEEKIFLANLVSIDHNFCSKYERNSANSARGPYQNSNFQSKTRIHEGDVTKEIGVGTESKFCWATTVPAAVPTTENQKPHSDWTRNLKLKRDYEVAFLLGVLICTAYFHTINCYRAESKSVRIRQKSQQE